MLVYNKYLTIYKYIVNISKGIDVNKTSDSNECRVCRYWDFSKTNFTYETLVCNGCNFWFITKSEAVNTMKNVDLNKKVDNYDYEKIIYYSDVV